MNREEIEKKYSREKMIELTEKYMREMKDPEVTSVEMCVEFALVFQTEGREAFLFHLGAMIATMAAFDADVMVAWSFMNGVDKHITDRNDDWYWAYEHYMDMVETVLVKRCNPETLQ